MTRRLPPILAGASTGPGPAHGYRSGYLSLLLPFNIFDDAAIPAIRKSVVEALAVSGEYPASIEVVARTRSPERATRRWFVEYAAGPPATSASGSKGDAP